MKLKIAAAALCLLLAGAGLRAEKIPAQPGARVNDLAGILKPDEVAALESLLQAYDQESSCQLVLLTVNSLDGDAVEMVANRTFTQWKLGTQANNNGVLMLIAMQDRKLWIEVGYGLEGRLTDAVTSSIYRNTLTPALRQQSYYEGIRTAFEQVVAATRGEYTARQTSGSAARQPSRSGSLGFMLFFIIVILLLVISRTQSGGAGTAIRGRRGRTYWTGGGGGFFDGGGGGGGFGGFSGGGFSGGGGMSGGGGAGGSW